MRPPWTELTVRIMQMVLCFMLGTSFGKQWEQAKTQLPDTSKWVEPTPEPRLEPTPSQEEINERVTKALRLNPPL